MEFVFCANFFTAMDYLINEVSRLVNQVTSAVAQNIIRGVNKILDNENIVFNCNQQL